MLVPTYSSVKTAYYTTSDAEDTSIDLLSEYIGNKLLDDWAESKVEIEVMNIEGIDLTGLNQRSSFLLTGTTGSVDSLAIGDYSLLSASIPFNTDLDTTAADIVTDINNNQSNFLAEAVGARIFITANQKLDQQSLKKLKPEATLTTDMEITEITSMKDSLLIVCQKLSNLYVAAGWQVRVIDRRGGPVTSGSIIFEFIKP